RPKPLGPTHECVARALRPSDWALLQRTQAWLDLPRHQVRVVHAGVEPGLPFALQERWTLMHIRTIDADGEPSEEAVSRSIKDRGRHERRSLWGSRYIGPPHVVFGHNAAQVPQIHRWATGLDTGCVYGGELTALILDAGEPVPNEPRER